MKKISIVSSCYNEEENLDELYNEVSAQWDKLSDKYEFEFILLDNGSTDGTEQKLRELAQRDKRVKVILNSRNFGQNNSPMFGVLNASGDAVISIASDLQDPPELIPELIKKWENGNQVVFLQKISSKENPIMYLLRKLYYRLLDKMSDNDVKIPKDCTGSGLFDRVVIEALKTMDDPHPFFRGAICECGFKRDFVLFVQPLRKHGKSYNNLYTLYVQGILGFTKLSNVPLRLMAFTGFVMSIFTFLMSIFYLVWKLIKWDTFSFGLAPIIMSVLFLGSIQLLCLGILGEYIAAINSRVNKKPLVIVKEKINF